MRDDHTICSGCDNAKAQYVVAQYVVHVLSDHTICCGNCI